VGTQPRAVVWAHCVKPVLRLMHCLFPWCYDQLVGTVQAEHVPVRPHSSCSALLSGAQMQPQSLAQHRLHTMVPHHSPWLCSHCIPAASTPHQEPARRHVCTDAAQPFVEMFKRQADCRLAHPAQCRFHRGCPCQGYITVGLAVQNMSGRHQHSTTREVSTSL
jgi:hypothetical protein